MTYINYYLLIVNIYEFIVMGIDKYLAIKQKRRISEKHLITFSLIGGSLGGILGMNTFRHKTKKLKFTLTYPLFLLIHLAIYYYIKKTL